MQSRNRGFTLIELLIIIVVIAILALIVIPKLTDASRKANMEAAKQGQKTIGIDDGTTFQTIVKDGSASYHTPIRTGSSTNDETISSNIPGIGVLMVKQGSALKLDKNGCYTITATAKNSTSINYTVTINIKKPAPTRKNPTKKSL